MAQQTIVTYPAVAKDSTQGTPLADAFKMVNDNFNELYGKPDLSLATNTLTLTKGDGTTDTVDLAPYLDDTAIVSASIDGAGLATFVNSDTSTFTLDLSSLIDDVLITSVDGSGGLEVDTTTGDVTVSIADDGVTYAKLGAEFTTTAAVTTALDFGSAQVFTKTMTADTTFTYSNVGIGMVKDFILTGAFVPTFPAGTKTIAGTYDGSVSNLIQIIAVASGDYWMSISKAQ